MSPSSTTPREGRSKMGQALFDGLEGLPGSKRLTGEQLEVIYSLAYAHVAQNQHAQALPIFAFLCQYGPTRRHYLAGLSLCLHMAGRYQEAVNIQSLQLVLFPTHLEPALQMAESLAALGDAAGARDMLRKLAEAGDATLAERARVRLERLARPS